MGNSFFKYKQFTIHQDKCAMKVCTDTSLFGALIEPNKPTNILDIGAGTGVLSLMIAQKTEGKITAVEIDKEASIQAKENAGTSPWNDRVEIINDDIIKYAENSTPQFDLIISNPPFFQGNMLANVRTKNLARHNTSLTLDNLATCINKLLTDNGQFWVLLPEYEATLLEDKLNKFGLSVSKQIHVKNYTEDTKISRTVNYFKRDDTIKEQKEIAIYKDQKREYTTDFIGLLKPYYLYL